MATDKIYISAGCSIRRNQVWQNGRLLFESAAEAAPDFLEAVYRHFDMAYPKFFKMDKLSKLGMLAAHVLLQDFDKEQYQPEELGIVLSNANASLDADIRYMESTATIPSPALFVYTLPNIVIGELSSRYQFKGENAFFITETFDANLLQFYVKELMLRHRVEVCIAGWTEIVGENYEAVLFLASKGEDAGKNELFTTENINKLYATYHGEVNANAERATDQAIEPE